MGMLLRYHEGYGAEPAPVEDKPKRRRNRAKPAEPVTPEPAPDLFAPLSDDEVLEAYTKAVPDGDAADRDAMVAALKALAEDVPPVE